MTEKQPLAKVACIVQVRCRDCGGRGYREELAYGVVEKDGKVRVPSGYAP